MVESKTLPGMLWDELTSSLDTRWRRVTFLVIMACALGLRLAYLGQDMRFDESWTYVDYAIHSFGDILTLYDSTNNHILHTLLVATVTKIFGGSPEVIRLPALFFGLLMLPLVQAVASRLYDRDAALVATALTAASSCLVEYSTNGRGYTMLADLTLVAYYAALRLRRDNRLSLWLGLGCVGALGFWVSPIMLYGFGSVALYLFGAILAGDVTAPRRQALFRLGLACGLGAVLTVLFYIPGFVCSPVMNQSHLKPLPWDVLWAGYLHPYSASLFLWTRDMPQALSWPLVALCAVSIIWHRRLAGERVPVVLCGLVWPVIVGLFYHVAPITRSLLYLLPLCLVSLSGTVGLVRRWLASPGGMERFACLAALGLTLLSGALVLGKNSVPFSSQTGLVLGAREAARYLAGNASLRDGMAFSEYSEAAVEYYLYRDDVPYRWLRNKARKTMWVVSNPASADEPPATVLRRDGIDCPFTVLESRMFRMVRVDKVSLDCGAEVRAGGDADDGREGVAPSSRTLPAPAELGLR